MINSNSTGGSLNSHLNFGKRTNQGTQLMNEPLYKRADL